MLVDHGLSFAAADIVGNQFALDGGGREPLVPQRNRQGGDLFKIAREGAGRLRAGAFAAVHVDWQPKNKAGGAPLGGERQQRLGVGREICACDGCDPGSEAAVGIAGGDADGLGAEVKTDKSATLRQQRCGVDEGKHRHGAGSSMNRVLRGVTIGRKSTIHQVAS